MNLKKLLHLYNDGHQPFIFDKKNKLITNDNRRGGRGGLGYHPTRMYGKSVIRNDDGTYTYFNDDMPYEYSPEGFIEAEIKDLPSPLRTDYNLWVSQHVDQPSYPNIHGDVDMDVDEYNEYVDTHNKRISDNLSKIKGIDINIDRITGKDLLDILKNKMGIDIKGKPNRPTLVKKFIEETTQYDPKTKERNPLVLDIPTEHIRQHNEREQMYTDKLELSGLPKIPFDNIVNVRRDMFDDLGLPYMTEEQNYELDATKPKTKDELIQLYDSGDFTYGISPDGNIFYNTIYDEELKNKNLDTTKVLLTSYNQWVMNGDEYKKSEELYHKDPNKNPNPILIKGNLIEDVMFIAKENISEYFGDTSKPYNTKNLELYKSKLGIINPDFLNYSKIYGLGYIPIDFIKPDGTIIECKNRNDNFLGMKGDDYIKLDITKFEGFYHNKNGLFSGYKILLNDKNQIEIFYGIPTKNDVYKINDYKKDDTKWERYIIKDMNEYLGYFFYQDGVYIYDIIKGCDKKNVTFKNKNYFILSPKKGYREDNNYVIPIDIKKDKEYFTRIPDNVVNKYMYKTLMMHKNNSLQDYKQKFGSNII